jgi:hypothetical protein
VRIEPRYKPRGKRRFISAAVFVAETESESKILDAVFGKTLKNVDGLIGNRDAECRLSDGCGEHYVIIKKSE